jgi:uncharacterized protein YrrD
MLILLRNKHIFHAHQAAGVYTIDEIVSHVVLISINSEGHFRGVTVKETLRVCSLMTSTNNGN